MRLAEVQGAALAWGFWLRNILATIWPDTDGRGVFSAAVKEDEAGPLRFPDPNPGTGKDGGVSRTAVRRGVLFLRGEVCHMPIGVR